MKKFKVFASCLLTAVIAVGTVGCSSSSSESSSSSTTSTASSSNEGSAEAQYNWQIGHALSEDHPYQYACERFAELLNEYSDGAINLEIFPAGQLGGERDMYEGLQMGTIDFALGTTSPLVNFDPSFNVFDMPFIFNTKEEAYKVLDSDYGQSKLDSLSNFGIKGLCFEECGFFNFIYTGDEIRTPEDMKGKTFRTMESDTTMTWIMSTGSNPVPMAFSELFTAMQNGTVDGTILPITTIYFNKIYQVADNYSMLNITYSPLPLMMSQQLWDSLPEDIQEIVQQAAYESRDAMREYTSSVEDDALETMKSEGLNVIEFSDDERQVWIDFIKENAYPELVPNIVPQEDMDAIEEVLNS